MRVERRKRKEEEEDKMVCGPEEPSGRAEQRADFTRRKEAGRTAALSPQALSCFPFSFFFSER
jgi:hypothetical protein